MTQDSIQYNLDGFKQFQISKIEKELFNFSIIDNSGARCILTLTKDELLKLKDTLETIIYGNER